MHTILLVIAGPPVSAPLWDDVVRRNRSTETLVQTIDLFDPIPSDPTVGGLAERLSRAVEAIPGPVVLVGHGTAIPVKAENRRENGVARTGFNQWANDPMDPFRHTFCRLASSPRFLASTLLQPNLLCCSDGWHLSSAGLRRAVVNPYVMDRDMVVAVSETYLKSKESRMAVAGFLNDLPMHFRNCLS